MKKKMMALALTCVFLLTGCGTMNGAADVLADGIAGQLENLYVAEDSELFADQTKPTQADIQWEEEESEVDAVAVFAQAEAAFGRNHDYQTAIQILQRSGLTGEVVDREIQKYQEYAPVLLKSFQPTKTSDYMYVGAANEGDYTDVNGNVYDRETVIRPRSRTSNDIAKSEQDSYVTYYLYGDYRNFDATLYRTYSSLSTIDEDWTQGTVAKIYGDDVLLYEGPQITRDTYEEYTIHIDVTGVRELKIVLLGVGRKEDSFALYSYYPLMAIANATIQK